MRFASPPTPRGETPAQPTGRRASSKASVRHDEVQIKNPAARALWEKWQHVGFMAWERMRRLHDKLSYLQEMEKLKNFSWEEWRKRFMKFMNHKKSRVTDLFRKMDTDNDGAVPREDFIDGILKTKFPTSRLEMGTVADIFDRNQDGYIDYQEFIAALRPDWERKGPPTDAEKIDDELQKEVALCTCRQKFRVHQVGEGKYRFGDSQKLRLVRILRSTVMVRVGGGWVALDEFLVKNDPCRAKGRTNVELREQFTLASGVSQSMTPFKSKAGPGPSESPTSSVSGGPRNSMSAGPITKIKEKTERSIGMTRPSVDYSGPSYEQDTFSRRASTQGRSSLTPGSQPGSRPPSRHGSNVSLNDSEDGRRGSSARRTSSFRTGARTSSLRPTPVGFGSGVPRKTSTPANGSRNRTDSNSSTDRTPMSNRTRTPSGSGSRIPRTGSGVGSGLRQKTTSSTTSYSADGSRFSASTDLRSAVDSHRAWQQQTQ